MFVATTPLPLLLDALRFFRTPTALVLVLGTLYRYLWVLIEETQRLLLAARLRLAGARRWRLRRTVAAALAALFSRTLARSRRIHRAMVLRGYQGRIPVGRQLSFVAADFGRLAVVLLSVAAAWLWPVWGRP